ncbi:MAG: lipoprotein-releasing system ATP-binding protein [Bacteroidales bacterium]|jgi:lipoprotein-releasing system ATP-binding protein|nr:lipoprotein-releasing system ATP-binding protein [Bacteroidales bacterium]MDN5329442.1 lipoprotein-releasing system ATP-binding protein [Bacteroidales bacterium]
MDTLFAVEEVHKSYGTVDVLRGICLEVKTGEVLAIAGASGAGKSTLLHIMGSLEKPDKGSIFFRGVNILEYRKQELARFRNHHIGFVFQFHHLLPEFTAIENVCIPAYIAGIPKKEALSRATQLLEFMGLRERIHHRPAALSGGEQQRVAVARALMNNPEVVLADEPSGNLDSASATALHNLFFDLRREFGTTFVIVTHNDTLATLSDRRLLMKDGIVVI